MTAETAKPRKLKPKAPFVIGTWSADGKVFTAVVDQPEPAITEFGDAVAFVKEKYETRGGVFQFVRRQLNAKGGDATLELSAQQVMKAVLN